jgi:hypothetical protein
MYDNVVAVLLFGKLRQRTNRPNRHAEDDFYRRLSHPYPHWLGRAFELVRRRETKRGGIAAAPDGCRDRCSDQNSDHSCLTAALPRVAGAV